MRELRAFGAFAIPHPDGATGLFRLRLVRRWRTPEALLLPIGEALAQLVCDEDFSNVKACEGHPCTVARQLVSLAGPVRGLPGGILI
jgi:predicted RNA-binding Zn ribbon-like protein